MAHDVISEWRRADDDDDDDDWAGGVDAEAEAGGGGGGVGGAGSGMASSDETCGSAPRCASDAASSAGWRYPSNQRLKHES